MNTNKLRHLLAAVLIGTLVGGGLMATAPAGAQMASAVATSWKKIWIKRLQPQADKRYYTKADADAKYAAKADADGKYASKGDLSAAAAAAAARAEAQANTATDSKLGSYYTKAQTDARYAPAQHLFRGSYMLGGAAVEGGVLRDATGISWGATFPSAPTPHYIKVGDLIPDGCSGTASAPDAAPGHLCVFETAAQNVDAQRICSGGTASCSGSDPWGATIYVRAVDPGAFLTIGTWAARPSGPVTSPTYSPARAGAINDSGRADVSLSGS